MLSKFFARFLRSVSARASYRADRLDPVIAPIVVLEPPTPHQLWLEAEGDKVLRVEYPLSCCDTVLDVGGYEGQWASDIYSRYLCKIHVFEPIPQFAESIRRRFRQNVGIVVHQCGLGGEDGDLTFSIEGDASSAVVSGQQTVQSKLVAFNTWCLEHNVEQIGLMKVNIEGGEYPLVEHLIQSGWIRKVRNLQVQFHDFVPDARARMDAIKKQLTETHRQTYQFEFVWENWTLKD